MIKKFLTILSYVFIFFQICEAKTWSLKESDFIKWAKEDGINKSLIEADHLSSQASLSSLLEKYQHKVILSGQYQDSNEKGIASFVPQFGPTHQALIGLEKKQAWGLNWNIGLFTDQRSTVDGSIDRATRTGVQIRASMDLWKNWLGQLDRAQWNSLEVKEKISEIQNSLSLKKYELDFRRMYWNLVANNEFKKISENLLKSANRQLKDAQGRLSQSMGDKGDVARLKALVATREGNIAEVEFQKTQIVQSLKNQIPILENAELTLAPYDIEATFNSILVCADKIQNVKDTPWEWTQIDELIKHIDDNFKQQKIITDTYSKPSLNLEAQMQWSGVDQGTSKSYEDFSDNKESGYAVGLNLVFPIENQSHKTQKLLTEIDRLKFQSSKQLFEGQIKSQHEEIRNLIGLLKKSYITSRTRIENLEISQKSMLKKYQQARIPLSALITDEDSLFQSMNSEISLQLTVIDTLFKYLETFNNFNCEIN